MISGPLVARALLGMSLAGLAAGASLGDGAKGGGESIEELYVQGLYAELDEGDLNKAVLLYESILEGHPENRSITPRAAHRLGTCHLMLGDLDDAEVTFQRLLDEFGAQGELARDTVVLLRKVRGERRLGEEPVGEEAESASWDDVFEDALFRRERDLRRRGNPRGDGQIGKSLEAMRTRFVEGPPAGELRERPRKGPRRGRVGRRHRPSDDELDALLRRRMTVLERRGATAEDKEWDRTVIHSLIEARAEVEELRRRVDELEKKVRERK